MNVSDECSAVLLSGIDRALWSRRIALNTFVLRLFFVEDSRTRGLRPILCGR